MSYGLTTPCANCPFRTDVRPYITAARAREILSSEGEFHCHKTLDYSDGEGRERKGTQVCAGFLICLEYEGRPNQMMRIAGRIGMYDPRKLNMGAPVYRGVSRAIAAHKKSRAPQYSDQRKSGDVTEK